MDPRTENLERNLQAINSQFFNKDFSNIHIDKPHVYTYDKDLITPDRNAVIFIDTVWNEENLLNFLNYKSPHGNTQNNVTFIFTHQLSAKILLESTDLSIFLNKGTLYLSNQNHWKDLLKIYFKDIRSPYLICNNLIGDSSSPIFNEVLNTIQQSTINYKQRTDRALIHIKKYYQSDKYNSRLEKIKLGEKLRVYICRTCSSNAVKRFSDAVYKHLNNLGCEVYIHEPCSRGQNDYVKADYIEIARFKPDFIILNPNLCYFDTEGLPKIYSFQDIAPFQFLLSNIKPGELGVHDFVILHYERFNKEIRQAKFSKNQVLFHHLSADDPVQETQTENPLVRVGLLKTMIHSLSLIETIYVQRKIKVSKQTEINRIQKIEEQIKQFAEKPEPITDKELFDLGENQPWADVLPSFFAQLINISFLRSLLDQNIPFDIMGRNWEHVEDLSSHHIGYAESPKQIYSFMGNHQINLSINNSLEIHQRIFEGAQSKSFFLVYKLNNDDCLSKMPPDMIPGEHFDYFETKEELAQKCKYYLDRPDLCKIIGENLHSIVQEKYSYENLCLAILDKFKSNLKT